MRTVRKMLAFMLAAGLMASAMSVFASGGYNYTEATNDGNTYFDELDYSNGGLYDAESGMYWGIYPPSDAGEGETWEDMNLVKEGTFVFYTFRDGQWIDESSGNVYQGSFGPSGSSDSSSDSDSEDSKSAVEKAAEAKAEAEAVAERLAWEEAGRGAVRLAGVASDEGFEDVGDMFRAAEKSMSAGEFYNNVVVSTPGIENAMTVGQGGNLIVNGQVTNMTASISKVTNRAYVDSVRIEQEGTVLNVVDVSYPATEATVNFYTPGITGEENIVALQYNAGAWVEVEVAEVRADHVTLNLKGNGVVAFIAK